jgi:hypothetical protein
MLIPGVDGGFSCADGFGRWERWIDRGWRDDGESGSHRAVTEPGIEDAGAQSLGCDAVAVSFRDTLDEAMQAQATQVVGDAYVRALHGRAFLSFSR